MPGESGVIASPAAGNWKSGAGDDDASNTYAARRSVGRVGCGTVVQPAFWNSPAPGNTSCPSMIPPYLPPRPPTEGGSPFAHEISKTGCRYTVTVSTGTSTNVIG